MTVVAPDAALLNRAVSQFMGAQPSQAFAHAPNTLAFVALNGPDITGSCWGYQIIRPDDTSMLYLHQLEVDPAHRRTGGGLASQGPTVNYWFLLDG